MRSNKAQHKDKATNYWFQYLLLVAFEEIFLMKAKTIQANEKAKFRVLMLSRSTLLYLKLEVISHKNKNNKKCS